jgi:hypothetical protein
MNAALLIANLLTALAFVVHTFIGDKELKINEPSDDSDVNFQKREKWTMARCGWHWVSFDLLLASLGLGLVNFTSFFNDEKTILHLLGIYFLGYALVWFLAIAISKPFANNYLKLGQWVLLLIIGVLIWVGG